MSAPTLFDAPETQGRSRKSDPQTSVDAAKTVKAGSQRWLVLRALYPWRTTTADDMQILHPRIHRSTWSTRLSGLAKDGLVEAYSTVRHGGTGRRVLVYRLTDKGREALG